MKWNNTSNYLMRRVSYGASHVKIHCDIRIKWLQEIYFESIRLVPKAILGKTPFTSAKIIEDHIHIDLTEWSACIAEISSAFRLNQGRRIQISKQIHDLLNSYENKVMLLEKSVSENTLLQNSDIVSSFNDMALVDAFSIFNMLIPFDFYAHTLNELEVPEYAAVLDHVLVCPFHPHRVLLRLKKIETALALKKSPSTASVIQEYINKYLVYSEFENWIFDTSKLDDVGITTREIQRTVKDLSIDEMQKEIDAIERNRNYQLVKKIEFLSTIESYAHKKMSASEINNLLHMFSFLSLIVAEEEQRHMLECRHFVIIGKLFKILDIDPARSRLEDIQQSFFGLAA